ncbi:MAG: hypothetical protein AAF702_45760 [Chloroflexota bacterium]
MPKRVIEESEEEFPSQWGTQTTISIKTSNRKALLYALDEFPEFDEETMPSALINRIIVDWFHIHGKGSVKQSLNRLSQEHTVQTELLQEIAQAVKA